jgi:hypothetical protein
MNSAWHQLGKRGKRDAVLGGVSSVSGAKKIASWLVRGSAFSIITLCSSKCHALQVQGNAFTYYGTKGNTTMKWTSFSPYPVGNSCLWFASTSSNDESCRRYHCESCGRIAYAMFPQHIFLFSATSGSQNANEINRKITGDCGPAKHSSSSRISKQN